MTTMLVGVKATDPATFTTVAGGYDPTVALREE